MFVAAFSAADPALATAQASVPPSRQQQVTGLLEPDEAAEVARTLDEAESKIGRPIGVDVVVDEDGRRVSTDWIIHTAEAGGGYAVETTMPVLAEDVNTPGGIVVLVDPFQGTGAFVEAPGLSDRDERHLSRLMTSEFRHGSYEDGLIAVAHGLEDRLAPLPPPAAYRDPATTETVSGAAVALFTGGIVAVVLLLGYFLRSERYQRPWRPDRGVAFVAARHDAETILSALSPRVLLLAEKETRVIDCLKNLEESVPDGEIRSRTVGLLQSSGCVGFWKNFVRVTALVDEDPEEALAGLHSLSTEIEMVLARLGEAEEFLCGSRPGEGSDCCRGDTTRKDVEV